MYVDNIEVVFLLILVALSVYDIFYKEVPLVPIIIEIAMGIANIYGEVDQSSLCITQHVVLLVYIIVFMVFLSKLNLMGTGDGLMLLAISMMYEPFISIRIYIYAYLCAAVFGTFLLMSPKTSSN